MAKKRKTLPKHFNELIESGDVSALQEVFNTCDLNAYGGYSKATALSFHKVPDELVNWLVERGADIDAVDTYKRTALHAQASSWHGNVSLLVKLGASIDARDYQDDTPLHMAAGSFKPMAVRELVAHGADIHAKNKMRQTPLEKALAEGNNASIESIAEIADILLEAGAEIIPDMAASVTRLGKNFEFHRENFNKDSLAATDAALMHLYELFHVSPVERRTIHDGTSPITVKANRWQTQHQELWEMLVPSQGAAKTVQGEVIRITGKVSNEILETAVAIGTQTTRKCWTHCSSILVHGHIWMSRICRKQRNWSNRSAAVTAIKNCPASASYPCTGC